MATGLRSFQLNGTPVASGVVNRLDRVMMILCGSPLAFLTSRKPSAPRPARLVDDDQGLLHQVVLGDHALDEAGHLVGAAAGAGGDDELDRLGRLPRGDCRERGERKARGNTCRDECATKNATDHDILL